MNNELKVLCIDDDEEIREALSEMCRSQGWLPLPAESVAEGLTLFDEQTPGIVLIDYHLPDINGIEGVRQLRRRSRLIPIIVFTIDDDQSIADAFLQAGANDFALKPIRAVDLISRIRLHIRLMESERQNLYGESGRKNISQATVALIRNCLNKADRPLTVNEIAREAGIAEQTAYRYLQHMTGDGIVAMERTYGSIGRPKQTFRLS